MFASISHKFDLDQIAKCFCADSGIQVASSMAENAKKCFRMKELAQWVAKQRQPCQTAELADVQDRIKELEKQLAQQHKRGPTEAEIGAKPIESSQPSEPSQPEGAPSSKRVRLPFKSSPSQTKSNKGKVMEAQAFKSGGCIPGGSSYVD